MLVYISFVQDYVFTVFFPLIYVYFCAMLKAKGVALYDDKFQIIKANNGIFLGDTRCVILSCTCQKGSYSVVEYNIFLTNCFGFVIIQIVTLSLYW